MLSKTQIKHYSHYFVITNPSYEILPAIYQLSAEYTQCGLVYDPHTRRQKWQPVKTYGVYVDHGAEFRFHIGQWTEFVKLMEHNGVRSGDYDLEIVLLKEPQKLPLKLQGHWKLREYQDEAVSFILEEGVPYSNCPLINLRTGKGKTVVALNAVAQIGHRFAVVVLAQYVDKWVKDITEILTLEKSDIGVIQGSDLLERTTLYPESGKPIPSAFVISITTLVRWYTLYIENREHEKLSGYACTPDEFFEYLGIGTVIFDEVHLQPHSIYLVHCFMRVKKEIALSATMLSKDAVIQKIQGKMFPRTRRFELNDDDAYVHSYACAYQIMNFNQSKLLTKEHGRSNYSQSAFEKSVLRNKTISGQYINMVLDLMQHSYVNNYQPGDKIIIFVGTAKMAVTMVNAINKRWNNRFDTRTYLEGDPYENVLDPDVRVTTIISGGTAVDIKGLVVAIMTNSIDSPISNVQALGRLREIIGRDVLFYYLYSSSIPKQVEYHQRKIDLFKGRVKHQKDLFLGTLYP